MGHLDDYPGPGFGCSAIAGCGSPEGKKKAVAQYCKGVTMEINSWKAMLYDVVVQAQELKGGDAAKAADTLALIKSIIRELDMAVANMENACPANLEDVESGISKSFRDLRVHYTKALEVISPGWFGG